MNDVNRANDRATAAIISRRAAAKGPLSPGRPVLGDSTRKEHVLFRRSRSLPVILLMLAFSPIAACGGMPEQRAYDIADGRAEWRDKFSVDKRACAAHGGVIVQERHQPDSIRIGGSGPEVGARYYCRY